MNTGNGPVPDQWMHHGAPPEALAAFGEGACPMHLSMLAPGMIKSGKRWLPAGWCDICQAWWHGRTDDPVIVLGAVYQVAAP